MGQGRREGPKETEGDSLRREDAEEGRGRARPGQGSARAVSRSRSRCGRPVHVRTGFPCALRSRRSLAPLNGALCPGAEVQRPCPSLAGLTGQPGTEGLVSTSLRTPSGMSPPALFQKRRALRGIKALRRKGGRRRPRPSRFRNKVSHSSDKVKKKQPDAASLVLWGLQMKTTMRCRYAPIRLAKLTNSDGADASGEASARR